MGYLSGTFVFRSWKSTRKSNGDAICVDLFNRYRGEQEVEDTHMNT